VREQLEELRRRFSESYSAPDRATILVGLLGLLVLLLTFLSPLALIAPAMMLGISIIGVFVRVAQRRSIQGWSVVAAASIASLFVFSGISVALYGTDFGEGDGSGGTEVTDGATPGASNSENQYSDGGEEAAIETTIRSHYEAIGDNDFEEAYSYFGPTFRNTTEEEVWIEEEESYDITSSIVHSVDVEEVSGDTATATVDVSFEDNTGTPRFSLVWSLVKEDGQWKLDEVTGGGQTN
jgi:hypothetical protein